MSLRRIAKKTGVSTTTVHRVLRGKGYVAPKTVELVTKAMKEMGYLKHSNGLDSLGRISKSSLFKTGCIGLLLIERPVELLQVPLNARILSEIEKSLVQHDLLLSIIQVPEQDKISPMVCPERLDGLLLLGEPASERMRLELKQMHAVGLFSSERCGEGWADWVTSDYSVRGHLAVQYLKGKGHKRVAFFNPQLNHRGFKQVGLFFRMEAVKMGLQVKMFVSERASASKMWKPENGETIVQKLVDEMLQIPRQERPTGLHVVDDEIALSVYHELKKRGIKPGVDMEIISCNNDEEYLSKMDPRPATMDLNVDEIARRAVAKLIYRIKNPDALAGITVLVPPRLVPADAK